MCALTKTSDSTRVAHIYPLSLKLKDISNGHEDLWSSLDLFFSTERVERWKRAVFGQDNETPASLLRLGPVAYILWSKCRYALKPIEVSPDSKQLTVQFFWMPWWNYAPLKLEDAPEAPDNTDISACGTHLDNIHTGQRIQSGDIITFITTDPEKLPLPSMDLLDLQWVVHRLNALSGAVEATDAALGLDDAMELGLLDDVGEYDVGIWIDQPGEGKGDTDDEWEQVEVETKPLTLRLRSSVPERPEFGRLENTEL